MTIHIVGLGLGRDTMSLRGARLLTQGMRVVLRTGRCEAARYLDGEGVSYETLDALYERAEDFDQLADALSAHILGISRDEEIVYGVLDVRDESVLRIQRARPDAEIVPGTPVEGALLARALEPCALFAAADWADWPCESDQGALIREIASPALASSVKLRLMERYPEEAAVWMSAPDGHAFETVLCELDRQANYDHRVCAYVPAQRELTALSRYGFAQLNRIVSVLRGPDGCPWDRAQTHESLRRYVVEEAWEVSGAIAAGDEGALVEELGDLLLQVGLHAHIGWQHGIFDMDDVTSAICRKMLSRHPHVFGGAHADTLGEVNALWDEAKRREKGAEALGDIGKELPALMRAQKVLSRLRRGGARGLPEARQDAQRLGDGILDAVSAAVDAGIDAETALIDALERRIAGFWHENM